MHNIHYLITKRKYQDKEGVNMQKKIMEGKSEKYERKLGKMTG